MSENKPRIKLPTQAAKGEIIEIKTLITHPMESGLRKGPDGKLIPRMIINRFVCQFNNKPVFEADLETGVSANPYIEFYARIDEAGTFTFTWVDDENNVVTAEEKIALEA
ncbi:MAG: thiosulfate oxidation carrier complex protein SoxZ [Roseiarcus sp.]